jgi:alginate O-acetyltransferase complex protein AlgI
VRPVFDAQGVPSFGMIDCWAASLAYALQIYFDFSGYSDMAIGLSRLFGVRLPLNFHSPYQAINISEFWRRWHMTLSRFLRDYLYIPLGGNRKGKFRRYVNLAVTMLLGGLWHGAGWTYVIWGGLHGLYLIVHQAWQSVRPKRVAAPSRAARAAGVALTFVAVVIAWVFFRAPSASQAVAMLTAMLGFEGVLLPDAWRPAFGSVLAAVPFGADFFRFGSVAVLQDRMEALAILAGVVWVMTAPNTQEVMQFFSPALNVPAPSVKRPWLWQPNPLWATASAVLLTVALLNLTQVSDFLYFQF